MVKLKYASGGFFLENCLGAVFRRLLGVIASHSHQELSMHAIVVLNGAERIQK